MFDGVVGTYDLLNRLLTWGLDGVWRKLCARECNSSGVVVDLCCGTGDLALHILKQAAPEACIVGLDFSKAMLKAAGKKLGRRSKIDLVLADAAHMPFKEGCVDRIAISFSFRNLTYRNPKAEEYLKEVLRTLRCGGRFVCVETSQPKQRPLKILYHLYLRKIVPWLGGLVSGRKAAYRYLGASAVNFPPAEQVAEMLLNAGFQEASFKLLAFGVVALHVGVK